MPRSKTLYATFGASLLMIAALASPALAADPMAPGVLGAPAGTGPSPAVAESRADLPAHTLYRPQALPDKPLPLVIWGNGACSNNGLQHGVFLREIASHGYIIVSLGAPRAEFPQRAPKYPAEGETAPPPRAGPPGGAPAAGGAPAGPPRSMPGANAIQMTAALDWATAENARAGGPLEGKVDLTRIAAAGHSCGGMQALMTGADARIDTTLIFNSGLLPGGTKEALDKLQGPALYVLGGPTDIAYTNAVDDFERLNAVPVFFSEFPVGHDGTFWTETNGGEWARVATAWLDWRLKGDAVAGKTFTGQDCGLCKTPRWKVRKKRID